MLSFEKEIMDENSKKAIAKIVADEVAAQLATKMSELRKTQESILKSYDDLRKLLDEVRKMQQPGENAAEKSGGELVPKDQPRALAIIDKRVATMVTREIERKVMPRIQSIVDYIKYKSDDTTEMMEEYRAQIFDTGAPTNGRLTSSQAAQCPRPAVFMAWDENTIT